MKDRPWTPEPWEVVRQDASVWNLDHQQIARTAAVPGCGMAIHWNMEARQANARLIAQAPRMYEALEKLVDDIQKWEATRAALSDSARSVFDLTEARAVLAAANPEVTP